MGYYADREVSNGVFLILAMSENAILSAPAVL